MMCFGSAIILSKILSTDKDMQVGSDIISTSNVVCDLGVFIDSELNMKLSIKSNLTHLILPLAASACCAPSARA